MDLYGRFYLGDEGVFEGGVYFDMDNTEPMVRKDLDNQYIEVTKGSSEYSYFEDLEAFIRVERDMEGLYFLKTVDGKDSVSFFLDEEGELDSYKVYYQGNNLESAYKMQDLAYKCLDFIITSEYYREYVTGNKIDIKNIISVEEYKELVGQGRDVRKIESEITFDEVIKKCGEIIEKYQSMRVKKLSKNEKKDVDILVNKGDWLETEEKMTMYISKRVVEKFEEV